MCGLKTVLAREGITQVELAGHLGLSKAAVCQIANYGQFPKGREAETRDAINKFLDARGVPVKDLWKGVRSDDEDEAKEACVMLGMNAKRQFRLVKDPFTDDVTESRDVYLSQSGRYVAEYMYMTAKAGGMLAVVGESGSGKSTLRRLLLDRIDREDLKIKVIFPRSIDKGKLTASSICDAIVADCSEDKPRRTLEAKSRQIERVLTASSRAGWSHVLMIEEAHDLDVRTLKYLKRFWELEDGFKKLLSVILVAQPEIKGMLDESRNPEAREIIRRMEVAEISPFENPDELKEYLTLKFARVGVKVGEVMDEGCYQAILDKLVRKTRSGYRLNYAYPLTVNNMVKKAMNTAADIGQSLVDAETIASI